MPAKYASGACDRSGGALDASLDIAESRAQEEREWVAGPMGTSPPVWKKGTFHRHMWWRAERGTDTAAPPNRAKIRGRRAWLKLARSV